MIKGTGGGVAGPREDRNTTGHNVGHVAGPRPTGAQLRYLLRGLREASGKLPHFDEDGRLVPRKTVESCLAHGWAEPCSVHPARPDWQVCRLTDAGYAVLLEGYGAGSAEAAGR